MTNVYEGVPPLTYEEFMAQLAATAAVTQLPGDGGLLGRADLDPEARAALEEFHQRGESEPTD